MKQYHLSDQSVISRLRRSIAVSNQTYCPTKPAPDSSPILNLPYLLIFIILFFHSVIMIKIYEQQSSRLFFKQLSQGIIKYGFSFVLCLLEALIIYFISMKRPQSAKPIHNYFAHNNEDPLPEQPVRHFVKAGRKQMFNAMSASNDLSRMLPKKIQQDKERLYCETLQLKTNLNEITQENLRLKTKIATLQKEKDRLNRTDQPSMAKGRSSNMLNMSVKNEKQNGMVSNLKKMVREQREENQCLKAEIAKMKRAIRYTKINEIEVEKHTVFEENQRISRVIGQLQTELQTRVRQDEELLRLENQLQQKTKELKEVTSDNIKYEEILEEVQMRNREASDKLAAQQKKWQKDLTAQKRKIEQLNKQVELLQQEVKLLNQQLQEEKKKQTQQVKKTIRPASSRPYQQLESAGLKVKNTKEKEEALQINEKLKHQLEQAKRKLAESENKLKVTSKDTKENLTYSKDQTFELILTKNQANQFMKNDEKEYDSDFQQSPLKAPANINQLPIQQKVKNKSPAKSKKATNSPIIDDIRQILTFRMKYNRYPYEQLKEDIEVSPLTHFPYTDLLNMLTAEPFYLSQRYSEEFLKVCYGKNKIGINEQLDAAVLLQNLRAVIDDFQLFDEQQEGKSLYNIANFMTTHRQELQHRFQRIKDKNQCITRQQLTQVLTAFGLSHQQIDLAICYISISTQSLKSIKYMDLLDRFYLSNSKSLEINDKHKQSSEELSMGQNEDLDEGELIADDQLV